MKKFLYSLITNPIIFSIGMIIVYTFYGLVIGASLAPSLFIVYKTFHLLDFSVWYHFIMMGITIGICLYLFFIIALFIFGIVEKILVIGFKPGKYPTASFTFIRWLIYSGLHILLLNTVMPFMAGSDFAKIFYRILGAKIGKNVFINTRGLHDAYLLEIGDNVVIGGETDISCHIFEGNHLILGKIKIGDNTLIGTHCYIMPDVTIGNKCNIGLYSYIRKKRNIEDGSMIMAVPGMSARKVAELIKE